MEKFAQKYVETFMSELIAKNPGETEFHQAVREVLTSVAPYLVAYPYLLDHKIMERMVEPERVIIFRVPWMLSSRLSRTALPLCLWAVRRADRASTPAASPMRK